MEYTNPPLTNYSFASRIILFICGFSSAISIDHQHNKRPSHSYLKICRVIAPTIAYSVPQTSLSSIYGRYERHLSVHVNYYVISVRLQYFFIYISILRDFCEYLSAQPAVVKGITEVHISSLTSTSSCNVNYKIYCRDAWNVRKKTSSFSSLQMPHRRKVSQKL